MESTMKTIQWLNGNWEASIAIGTTHEVLTGQGVFETILVRDQVPEFLNLHLARLDNSCNILGLRSPEVNVIHAGIEQLIAIHQTKLGRLRITFFGGVFKPILLASIVDVDPWPMSARVIISPWTRNEKSSITGAKTVSYAENAVALKWAKDRGYAETLLFNNAGHLAEAATSNIVIVVDDKVLTPALSSGCLPGITRAVLLELGVVNEADIDADLLDRASSAALLSSTRGVQTIAVLGERELDVSCHQLRRLADSYLNRVERDKENWARLPKESRPV